MTEGCRFTIRLPSADWAEVVSHPDGHYLAIGHLKDVSEGGLAINLPVCIPPGSAVQIKLSKVTNGVLRRFQFSGTVAHSEAFGQEYLHGIKFSEMTQAEHTSLLDYLCQLEYYYRAVS